MSNPMLSPLLRPACDAKSEEEDAAEAGADDAGIATALCIFV